MWNKFKGARQSCLSLIIEGLFVMDTFFSLHNHGCGCSPYVHKILAPTYNCWWLPNLRKLVKSKEESKKKISKRVLLGLIKCLHPWKQHNIYIYIYILIEKNTVYNIFILPRSKPYVVILKFSTYPYWTAGVFFIDITYLN